MAKQVIDPVCEMHLDPVLAPFEAVDGERIYYFCSDRCYNTFRNDPEKYLNPEFAGENGECAEGEELETAGRR